MTGFLVSTIVYALMFNAVHHAPESQPKQLWREIEKISGCKSPQSVMVNPDTGIPDAEGRYYKYSNTRPVTYAYVGRVFTCRAEGCCISGTFTQDERREFFDYFILFDANARVLSVKVFNYEATHGQEITVKGWLRQFTGYAADKELVVGKDIDAIAGATISVNSITADVTEKARILRNSL